MNNSKQKQILNSKNKDQHKGRSPPGAAEWARSSETPVSRNAIADNSQLQVCSQSLARKPLPAWTSASKTDKDRRLHMSSGAGVLNSSQLQGSIETPSQALYLRRLSATPSAAAMPPLLAACGNRCAANGLLHVTSTSLSASDMCDDMSTST